MSYFIPNQIGLQWPSLRIRVLVAGVKLSSVSSPGGLAQTSAPPWREVCDFPGELWSWNLSVSKRGNESARQCRHFPRLREWSPFGRSQAPQVGVCATRRAKNHTGIRQLTDLALRRSPDPANDGLKHTSAPSGPAVREGSGDNASGLQPSLTREFRAWVVLPELRVFRRAPEKDILSDLRLAPLPIFSRLPRSPGGSRQSPTCAQPSPAHMTAHSGAYM